MSRPKGTAVAISRTAKKCLLTRLLSTHKSYIVDLSCKQLSYDEENINGDQPMILAEAGCTLKRLCLGPSGAVLGERSVERTLYTSSECPEG